MGFYGITGWRRAQTLLSSLFSPLARSQGLMQIHYTLALLFSLPLNALVTKGHSNPVTGLSIAVLAEHFAVSHSKSEKAFWKLCACGHAAFAPFHPSVWEELSVFPV